MCPDDRRNKAQSQSVGDLGTHWNAAVLNPAGPLVPAGGVKSKRSPQPFGNTVGFVTHSHSRVFSLTASSPSAICSSSSFSLASLCSGASWPNSLLVMPFREKVLTICTGIAKHCQPYHKNGITRHCNKYFIPQWPAPRAAASWR